MQNDQCFWPILPTRPILGHHNLFTTKKCHNYSNIVNTIVRFYPTLDSGYCFIISRLKNFPWDSAASNSYQEDSGKSKYCQTAPLLNSISRVELFALDQFTANHVSIANEVNIGNGDLILDNNVIGGANKLLAHF